MTNVLVTGGAGLSKPSLRRLAGARYKVRVLDSLIYGRREWVPAECEFIEGDIRDLAACKAPPPACRRERRHVAYRARPRT